MIIQLLVPSKSQHLSAVFATLERHVDHPEPQDEGRSLHLLYQHALCYSLVDSNHAVPITLRVHVSADSHCPCAMAMGHPGLLYVVFLHPTIRCC